MADFLLTVGIDTKLSYTEIQNGITQLVNTINKDPIKIKVQFDQSSLKSMKQQIQAIINLTASGTSSTTNVSSSASVSDTNAKTKAMREYATALVQGESCLRKWSAAEKSSHQSSQVAYQSIKVSIEAMKSAQQVLDGLSKSDAGYTDAVQNLKAKVEEFRLVLKEAEQTIKANGDATRTLSDRSGELAKKFASWTTISQTVMLAVRSIKKMVSAAIELDDAMTQMQIVTEATTAEMDEFADSAAEAAQRVASSISDFVDSATTYARLGYSMDESSQLAEYTAMLQNIGDIDVSDAQDAITSIVKAFDIDASDIESVIDKLVTTGNNFPISVSEIAEGMTNASSVLAAAGNSFEESVALLTAANTTLQDASKASTGLRTIAARIRNTTTELDELGVRPAA